MEYYSGIGKKQNHELHGVMDEANKIILTEVRQMQEHKFDMYLCILAVVNHTHAAIHETTKVRYILNDYRARVYLNKEGT